MGNWRGDSFRSDDIASKGGKKSKGRDRRSGEFLQQVGISVSRGTDGEFRNIRNIEITGI